MSRKSARLANGTATGNDDAAHAENTNGKTTFVNENEARNATTTKTKTKQPSVSSNEVKMVSGLGTTNGKLKRKSNTAAFISEDESVGADRMDTSDTDRQVVRNTNATSSSNRATEMVSNNSLEHRLKEMLKTSNRAARSNTQTKDNDATSLPSTKTRQRNRASSKIATNEETVVAPGENNSILLTTALHSVDKDKLHAIFTKSTSKISIHNTVAGLPIDCVSPLLRELDNLMRHDSRNIQPLIDWLDATLSMHATYISSIPTFWREHHKLYDYLQARVHNMQSLGEVTGKFKFLCDRLNQTASSTAQDVQTPMVTIDLDSHNRQSRRERGISGGDDSDLDDADIAIDAIMDGADGGEIDEDWWTEKNGNGVDGDDKDDDEASESASELSSLGSLRDVTDAMRSANDSGSDEGTDDDDKSNEDEEDSEEGSIGGDDDDDSENDKE